ncbi:hypothetical protein BT93_L5848 [Corymbia citriodora subsp. variegata]|uniref:Uncharacterized protein n=1 Tax=Corymbia citriodora subsp. variegata TaxID=360336 RepID=A0A8T0CVE7_CORYI|nr:hypothetical protein BT93_L5848 [Corymbia citriodora subsp. variegata]
MDPLTPSLDRNLNDWIVEVNENLKRMPSDEHQHHKKVSIYRVPHTGLNDKAYRPQAVSFGPYHHDNEHLRPMEEHKQRALLHFLKRCGKTLKPFLESLSKVARVIEESYDMLDSKWSSSEGAAGQFLKLMISDGCFMLKIMRTSTQRTSIQTGDSYAPDDPIFSYHGERYTIPSIKRDMLMLENQLPTLVLNQLVTVATDSKQDYEYINNLILKFCSPFPRITKMGKCLHVLDVFRKSMLMKPKKNFQYDLVFWMGYGQNIIRSAAELEEAGIRFKKNRTKSLLDISFANGVLRLPVIIVNDTTESMFLNLMAFERFHLGARYELTSYLSFMDKIIDNEQDIALLHKRGIIQNNLETDKGAAELFNSMSKGMMLAPDDRLNFVLKKVSKYRKNPWNVWRANLFHTYFRNPWVILSLIAAVLLFALTIIQTVYAVLSYNK